MDEILSGTTTLGQIGYGSNGNGGVLHIPKSSRNEASPSDHLMSCPEHSLGLRSYASG